MRYETRTQEAARIAAQEVARSRRAAEIARQQREAINAILAPMTVEHVTMWTDRNGPHHAIRMENAS